LNEEIRRRTHVVRIFPNGESCLRLIRALAVETHENWVPAWNSPQCAAMLLDPDDLSDVEPIRV
jgi:transposase-like protein